MEMHPMKRPVYSDVSATGGLFIRTQTVTQAL